ncbi:MAG: N-acetylmuramoyl-L-alanine amidase [Bacteroidota bacterium]
MANKLILLDAGHGGLTKGIYNTHPNKRVEKKHTQINEGVLNRAVVHLTAFLLDFHKIPCEVISGTNNDLSLNRRIWNVNEASNHFDCLLISVHHNFFGKPNPNGTEIFTYYSNNATAIAERFYKTFIEHFPNRCFRKFSESRPIKTGNFAILKRTACPAILTEFGFMSNEDDYYYISSSDGIMKQAEWLTDGCTQWYYSK